MCNLRTALARRLFLRACRHHPAHDADDRTGEPQGQDLAICSMNSATCWRHVAGPSPISSADRHPYHRLSAIGP
jgi:hypothetical protein